MTVVDDFSRECPAIEIDTSISGARIVRVLERLQESHKLPQVIVTDNGPEFTSRAMLAWADENNIRLHFIAPGKPTQNAFIESFNGKFRDECLNENWFKNLQDSQEKIETWRDDLQHQETSSISEADDTLGIQKEGTLNCRGTIDGGRSVYLL